MIPHLPLDKPRHGGSITARGDRCPIRLVFDAGDNHSVEAMLADPKPARDRKVKAGDSVVVTKCQVANPSETALPLRTCDLK